MQEATQSLQALRVDVLATHGVPSHPGACRHWDCRTQLGGLCRLPLTDRPWGVPGAGPPQVF